ncbi:hypothetical protein CHLNCDRAFT_13061, partial [Chlorella variabilis]
SQALQAGKVDAGFALHGVWPQVPPSALGGAGKRFQDRCSDTPYQPGCLAGLEDTISLFWPDMAPNQSLVSPDADSLLWAHEWEKHGTCSGMDQRTYFSNAVLVAASHNVSAVLQRAGIVPSDTQSY